MAKRTATSQLNHDNWDEEDKPEEAGTFKQASADDIKRRVIKTARRRGNVSNAAVTNDPSEEHPKNVFASFAGFTKADNNAPPAKAVFSFLKSSSNGQNTSTDGVSFLESEYKNKPKSSNGVENSVTSSDSASKESIDRDYYRKLKGLNEAVSHWILTHVSSNPLCILTPVFKDYEKHLANIQSVHDKDGINLKKDDTTPAEGPELKGSEETSQTKPLMTKPDLDHTPSKTTDDKQAFSSSIFGPSNTSSTASATFSFGSSTVSGAGGLLSGFGSKAASPSNNTPTFSFGAGGTSSPSAGFSFGTGKPFTFGNVAKPDANNDKAEEGDEEESPPKPDHKPVNEEGAIYTKRCKMFIKKDTTYTDRGVGNLFLKPVEGGRMQLIVRADTSLGNVLLNVLLGPNLPIQKVGSNNVAIVYMPPPQEAQEGKDEKHEGKPVTGLLRVKTSDDADELLQTLEKYKKAD